MLTDHTEYDEYHKLQLSIVFRYQHNNTLCKTLSNYRYRKNPQKYRDIIFFQYRTPLRQRAPPSETILYRRSCRTHQVVARPLLCPHPLFCLRSPHLIDGAEQRVYEKLPLAEAVAAHLCPATAGKSAKALYPSKPCRTTSALTDRAYSAAGQADSVLHSMAALQVFQAMDESVPGPATFKELRSATDLALCATKTTAQAIGRLMASLVVLECHLWLNLIEIKNADRTAFLNSPVSTTGLFGSAVDCFVEHFTAAQKSSQAFASHFSNKRSSHKAQSTQQPVKSALSPAQPKSKPEPELQQHPQPTKHYPLTKHQSPRPQRDVGP